MLRQSVLDLLVLFVLDLLLLEEVLCLAVVLTAGVDAVFIAGIVPGADVERRCCIVTGDGDLPLFSCNNRRALVTLLSSSAGMLFALFAEEAQVSPGIQSFAAVVVLPDDILLAMAGGSLMSGGRVALALR